MTRTLFFCMVFRKFSEITKNKPIFSQYNIFYNYEYFFFQSAFWSLFNHRQRSQSNQEQCSLCCGSPCFRVLLCTHYGPLQCFSTYFRKLKQIGVLQPIFPDNFYLVTMVHVMVFAKDVTNFHTTNYLSESKHWIWCWPVNQVLSRINSHKKRKDSLETRAVLIEIFMLCWNLPSGPKHRGWLQKKYCFPWRD